MLLNLENNYELDDAIKDKLEGDIGFTFTEIIEDKDFLTDVITTMVGTLNIEQIDHAQEFIVRLKGQIK